MVGLVLGEGQEEGADVQENEGSGVLFKFSRAVRHVSAHQSFRR